MLVENLAASLQFCPADGKCWLRHAHCEHGAASTYHQLGIIAQEQRDFSAAEGWYKKSLAITEKQGNEHGAASTYHQLGRIAEKRQDFPQACCLVFL